MKKILFIGNSHTFYNDMVRMVQELFLLSGERIEVTMLTQGGMNLEWHKNNPQTAFNLRYGNYDYCILQQKAHPFDGYEELTKGIGDICDLASGLPTKFLLYMTWARKGKSQEQEEISQGHEKAAKEHNILLAPVGNIWQKCLRTYPEIELYFTDGAHASKAGSFLAASCIFFALHGKIETVSEVHGEKLLLGDLDRENMHKIWNLVEQEWNQNSITLLRGQSKVIEKPINFSEHITWSVKFLKADHTFLHNSGYSKKKRELSEGEKEGTRKAGDVDAAHLVSVKVDEQGNAVVTGLEKGRVVLVADDEQGKRAYWKVEVLHYNPSSLPKVSDTDYATVRKNWKETLIGRELSLSEEGRHILSEIEKDAEKVWNVYKFKGQKQCKDFPWEVNPNGSCGNHISYTDDAGEMETAYAKVLLMAKAYAVDKGALYKNQDLFADIICILDYLSENCYTLKSQTDNWWPWEIGMPKQLLPILMLIYEDLSKEQVMKYTDALYSYQPDPYHEGAVGTGSTHGQGYREAQGANLIDCSVTAIGLGAVREDNELLYLGMEASASTLIIQKVENAEKLAQDGFISGFYEDGSYIDHGNVPYLGAYGLEFMKGAAKISGLLEKTPWEYSDSVRENLEKYVTEGFGNCVYQGLMLDSLKGRSVSRNRFSNRVAGREAMQVTLQLVDSFKGKAKERSLQILKNWLLADEKFVSTLTSADTMAVKKRAVEILQDTSIDGKIESIHQSYPLMDRAIHRRQNYLFSLAMYSERIQNTEIMNHENRMGWHQGNGMTYLYDKDCQFTEDFWNTVYPFRLSGTTVVPYHIGTGEPDSSGYAQDGNYVSKESWVGGTTLGEYGISGMAFSGKTYRKPEVEGLPYAPDLSGKKSWFMFDREIVCLGAGIENSNMDLPVETTVENRHLSGKGDNQFSVNGEIQELPVKKATLTELVSERKNIDGISIKNVKWAYLTGTKAVGTGYYFPDEHTTIQVRHGITTGNWSDVGTTVSESTQEYLEMWLNHGVNPKAVQYSYVLLPEMTKEETRSYVENPNIMILSNTEEIQAVYHKKLGILGINFWKEQGGSLAGIECDGVASVMIEQGEDGIVRMAVSDPTMKRRKNLHITISYGEVWKELVDSSISYEKEKGKVTFSFLMDQSNGTSKLAKVRFK